MTQGEVSSRPYWAARNWVTDERDGAPGVRGGSVAGPVHLDLCAALLVEEYGKRWFEQGAVSLYFVNSASDGEQVQAGCEIPREQRQVPVWVRRDDGLEIAEGTASLVHHDNSALRTRDLREADPRQLRILRELVPGQTLGQWHEVVDGSGQLARLAAGAVSDPLSWYGETSPWGGPIAAPSSVADLLWNGPVRALGSDVGEAVGLFGAIEVAFHSGPLLLGERVRITAELLAVTDSPRTESLWFDACAYRGDDLVVSQRVMLRFMKASSPLYGELQES